VDVDSVEAEDFLDVVWGDRKGWVDLPAKVGAYWVPYYLQWPADTEVTRRIDSCLRDGDSLYFSVARFKRRGRDYEDMMPTHWLWADLDEIHPTEAADLGIMPTLAWESSPGRYQALWRLHKALRPEIQERINQALSYHLGADQGGWDRTQVLRLPGTRNFKYPGGPPVQLMWFEDDLKYSASSIWDVVKSSAPPVERVFSAVPVVRGDMPAKARALLRVGADQVVEGERSARLWEIECLLAEAGWGEDDIYAVVGASAWNKWASVRTGERRLRREIAKAMRHVRAKLTPPGEEGEEEDVSQMDGSRLPWIRYSTFMAVDLPEPKWLIEDFWTASSHGIIGGEPKTSKSGLALDMAIAVASGKPFLGQYPVHTAGPVLVVQEENAPWLVQDRMRKLARFHRLIADEGYTEEKAEVGSLGKKVVELAFPADLPLRLLNNYGVDLTLDEDREMLEREIQNVRPVLVILDPLYLTFGGIDVDRANMLYPYLKWLLYLRNEYNTAVAVVHHFSKQPTERNANRRRVGQRLAGSHTLHGWVDSAMYCSPMEDERVGFVGVRVEPEFRSMAPRRPVDVRLWWGNPGDLEMRAEVSRFDLTGQILELIREQPGITANRIAEVLEVSKRTVMGRCRDSQLIEMAGGKRGRGHSWQMFISENGSE
jgi:hypothetical protein